MWLETFKCLGNPHVEDPINGPGTGPFVTPAAIDPVIHTRSHSAAAYLGPDVQSVYGFSSKRGRSGCRHDTDTSDIGAIRHWTIVTPRGAGIIPFIDLAGVGENLQDHRIVTFGYEIAEGLLSGDVARDPAVAAAALAASALAAYRKDGSGPLGMAPFVSASCPA